jgi:asparagine synthase (glutamine-hydrolysing)
MPGLTLASLSAERFTAELERFESAQSLMLHAPDYQAVTDLCVSGWRLGHISYPKYPVETFTLGWHKVYFEGRIYNKCPATLKAELRDLVKRVFDPRDREEFVRNWIFDHDGEYVVVIIDSRSSELAIVTDALGRLPLYCHSTKRSLAVSRECKFILNYCQDCTFDKIGCAQYLWTGYPLGFHTLFAGVNSAPGGMLLLSSQRDGDIQTSITSVAEFNLEEKDSTSRIADQHVSHLVDSFTEATRSRAQAPGLSDTVISLSGGWDSRAVAAAITNSKLPSVAISFTTTAGRGRNDARIARHISEALQIPHSVVELNPADEADEERLVFLKDGLNYAGMAFILRFNDHILSQWGRSALYLTGDGWPMIKSKQGLRASITTEEGLIQDMLAQHSLIPPSLAESIMDLPRGTIADELRKLFARYPEKNLASKAAHYRAYERGRRWNIEGEDRARYFFWQTSPFFGSEFFRYGMRIPDHLKSNDRLYRLFLRKLSPVAADIPDANTGVRPGSFLFPYAARIRSSVISRHWLRKRLKPFILRNEFGPAAEREKAFAYLGSAGKNHQLMNESAVRDMLRSANTMQFANWWTLALLEKLTTTGPYEARRQATGLTA